MFILIILLILFYIVEKFKNYRCNKKNLTSTYCIENKCKLPINSECSNNSNCKSNYCINNVCKSTPNCGVYNYQYNGNIIDNGFTSKSYNCNKRCSKDNNCTHWNWNKYNKMCSLLSKSTATSYNNNVISGTKDICNGNLICSICYQLKDKCDNSPTNINICSTDNKRIINSGNMDVGQYASYFNNMKPLKGVINCERKNVIRNTTLEKCREIANNQKKSGLNVVGYSVKYPSINYRGWCGPDTNIIKSEQTDRNVIYQTISNIVGNIINTSINSIGIRINQSKINNFDKIRLVAISDNPLNSYSDKQKIIGSKYRNNDFYIYTSLNTTGIKISKRNAGIFLNKSYIYISPSWEKNNTSKYPNCIYECLKSPNCGAVRWVNSTKDCSLLSKCSDTNTDNRWSHWIKGDTNNNNDRENIWKMDGEGIPLDNPIENTKNISLELCQYRCKKNNKCNQIAYSTEGGICKEYKNINKNIQLNPLFTTFTFS